MTQCSRFDTGLPVLLFLVCPLVLVGAGGCGVGEELEPSDPPNPLLRPTQVAEEAPAEFTVQFETTAGTFDVQVHRGWAPRGADRFYTLVKAGYYDDTRVHRVVTDFMAQFGIHGDPHVNQAWGGALIQDDPVAESNLRGRMSFAKAGANSRTTEVFISLVDNSRLDAEGFSPFGEVVRGMEVVDGLYAAYGDGPPRGDGPYAAMARARGNAYLDEEYPELTQILQATILSEGPE